MTTITLSPTTAGIGKRLIAESAESSSTQRDHPDHLQRREVIPGIRNPAESDHSQLEHRPESHTPRVNR